MTKQELIETYTAEQLAEMLEKFTKDNKRLQLEVGIYDNCILPRATKEARKLIDSRQYLAIKIVADQEWENREGNLQSEVEKYRKAFEDAKKERDCQIAEYQKKIKELTAKNEKLKGNVGSKGYCDKQNKTNNFYGLFANSAKDLAKDDVLIFLGALAKELIANGIDFRYEMGNEPKVWDIKIKSDKTIVDFLPTEPIKVADMLINASKKRTNCMTRKEYDKYIFEKWKLRQIAEHLLVYCNNYKEKEK